VDTETFEQFANNPFAVLRALRGRGLLTVENSPETTLASIELPGEAPAVDEGALAGLIDLLGGQRLAWLVESMLDAESLVIVGAENREWLLAGILNCFPVACRPELSFATGLMYSQRRPFRINALSIDNTEARRLKRQPQIRVFELGEEPPDDFCPFGWAGYLFEAFAVNGLTTLESELEQLPHGVRLADLADLAASLTHALHEGAPNSMPSLVEDNAAGEQITNAPPSAGQTGDHDTMPGHDCLSRLRPATAIASSNIDRSDGPSKTLIAPSREVLEQLEHLDDLVFETINGRQPALDELAKCWPILAHQLPPDLLAESREQYLLYAIKLWQLQGVNGPRDPAWAVAALDVLCVLFGGE
jgi:hypothetical protein